MLNYSSANRLHSSYFYRRPIAEQIIEIAIVATINITGDTCFFFKKYSMSKVYAIGNSLGKIVSKKASCTPTEISPLTVITGNNSIFT